MIDNASPRKLAYKELLNNCLSRPTLDNLIYLIESHGFDIIDFDNDEPNESISALIDNLNLRKMITSSKAFTYQNGDVKLVFVCDSLTAAEKKCALAHELGHIVLNHLINGCITPDITEEYQCNEFAHYLLNPSPLIIISQSIRKHKTAFIITAVVMVIFVLSIVGIQHVNKQNSYYGEYYITQSGEKYHDKDCIFIKNKKNIHRMTEEEYESGDYEPCQICLPNE